MHLLVCIALSANNQSTQKFNRLGQYLEFILICGYTLCHSSHSLAGSVQTVYSSYTRYAKVQYTRIYNLKVKPMAS